MTRLPPSLLLRVIALSIVLGMASGVIGAAVTTASLSNYAAGLGNFSSPLRPNVVRPSPPSVSDVRDQAFSVAAQLYETRTDAPDAFLADRQGVVLTSDGWLAAADPGRPLLTALIGRRSYPVQRSVPDPASGVVFLKIDAQRLPTVGFGDAFSVAAGDAIEAADARETFRPARVIASVRPAQYAADHPARRVLTSLPASSAGAAVFNAAGDLLGFAAADGSIHSINAALPGFRSLLKDGTARHPALGLTLLDLSRTVVPAASASAAPDGGARVLSAAKGSVAQTAGVRVGDVIRSWDGRSLDADHPLDELLLGDDPGQTVVVAIQRGTADLNLTLTLR